jgi:hypothetical protein
VGGVFVRDEVDVEIVGDIGLDLIEELAELGGAMTAIAFADDAAGGDVEGGKQRDDAMTLVVVAPASRLTRPHGSMG